jgi:alpha-tubulin suppressor-like RCC1 family protein
MHGNRVHCRAVFLSLALAALVGACGGDSTSPNVPAEIAIASVDTLRNIGATVTLSGVVRNASHQPISGATVSSWESSNGAVATVGATTGIVTAVGNGSATITAHVGAVTGSTVVKVAQNPASLTVVPPTDTLRSVGATGQYTVIAKDAGGTAIAAPVVRWTSSNVAVVKLDSVLGVATSVTNGAVYVRARSGTIIDSVALAVLQRVDPTKSTITVTRPFVFVDDTARATLQARDALSNPLTFGGAAVVFSSMGSATGSSSMTFLPTVDKGDGTYTSDFIGNGVGSGRTVAVNIDGIPVQSTPSVRVVGFTKVAAGGDSQSGAVTTTGGFTCGIITTGDMYCWGISWFGIRGNGTSGSYTPGLEPTLVSGNHQWIDVVVGLYYVCAVELSGTVYCWGDGDVGQMGNGASGNPPDVRTPFPISGGGTYASVSIEGQNGACGITVSGAAMCWGGGTWGRLGNGADTLVAVPVATNGGLSFSALSTNNISTCGIAAGKAYCWGYYTHLGLGGAPSPDQCSLVPCAKTPFAVSGGLTFRPIVADDGNVICAVATSDQAYCWGEGYLGNGAITRADTPTPVSGGLSFTSLEPTDIGHCGTVVGGAAYCWGKNPNGVLGNGTTTEALVPTAVSGGHAFTQLSSSQDHTCGVATDSNLYCWGGNDMGELGTRSTTASYVPVRVRLFSP